MMGNRRNFLKLAACSAAVPLAAGLFHPKSAFAAAIADDAKARRQAVIEMLAGHTETIEAVDLYGIQVDAERRFSWGVVPSRQHVFAGFRLGDHTGWSEVTMGYRKVFDVIEKDPRWKQFSWYRELVGRTVGEALAIVQENRLQKHAHLLENAEICLLDLAGRLLRKPANELLGLRTDGSVPGVYCILSDDPAHVRQEAQRSLAQNLRTHLKIKLYGSLDVDLPLIEAAREVMGDEAYIIGDVNNGYRRKRSEASLESVVEAMHAFRNAQLSACEDPADLSVEQWAELQKDVGALDLVPDAPVRHAWRDVDQIGPNMGRVYNMHPSGMGAVFETVSLGAAIRSWGKRLMVGDASLVGPACAAWTQLACGMQADWVEAIEKPQESRTFADCVRQTPLGRTEDHQFTFASSLPGFGLVLDVEQLRAKSYGTMVLS